ncbi:MAG: hypothetical protein ACYTF1_01800 [Planctomycetota bacterium]|jgi:hypothetical protein
MAEKQLDHNTECQSSSHGQHLCFLMHDGFHYGNREEYKAMVRDANYRCQNCARTAKDDKYLCAPVEL